MTGKIMPLRGRDTSTVQAAADAFLSSPRYANPHTHRGYTGVLDRLLTGLGATRWPRSAARSVDKLVGALLRGLVSLCDPYGTLDRDPRQGLRGSYRSDGR